MFASYRSKPLDRIILSLHVVVKQYSPFLSTHTSQVSVLREGRAADGRGYVAEMLVRRVPDSRPFMDLRVALLGSADAGKSTLIGKK